MITTLATTTNSDQSSSWHVDRDLRSIALEGIDLGQFEIVLDASRLGQQK
ncbi:MAG: hypothetical protein H0T51_00120 [Pirellulales bacterium]|nr:hypothetical protein [Pirellulales bacterium]